MLFPILLWISVRICRTHIQVKLLFPNGNLFPRSSFTGTIILKNTSWIPISTAAVSLSAVHSISGETVSFEQQAAIPPKGTARLTFSLRSDHCGYISIHLKKIRLLDSLHLFSCTKPLETRQDLLIQPRIPEPPEQIALSIASSGDTLQAVPEPVPGSGCSGIRCSGFNCGHCCFSLWNGNRCSEFRWPPGYNAGSHVCIDTRRLRKRAVNHMDGFQRHKL